MRNDNNTHFLQMLIHIESPQTVDMNGAINVVRYCGYDTHSDGCQLQKISNYGDEIETCICKTNLCNDKSMVDTFPSYVAPINCWHCSSTIQPWCEEKNLNSHINDVSVKKNCPSGTCMTEITGKP